MMAQRPPRSRLGGLAAHLRPAAGVIAGPAEAVAALAHEGREQDGLRWLWWELDDAAGALPDPALPEWPHMAGSEPGRAAVRSCVGLLLRPAPTETTALLCAAVLPLMVALTGPSAVTAAREARLGALSRWWAEQLGAGRVLLAALAHGWLATPLRAALRPAQDDADPPLTAAVLRPLVALVAEGARAEAGEALGEARPRQQLQIRTSAARLLTALLTGWGRRDRAALRAAAQPDAALVLEAALSFVGEVCGDGRLPLRADALQRVAHAPPDWLAPHAAALELLAACRWLFAKHSPQQATILRIAVDVLRMADAFAGQQPPPVAACIEACMEVHLAEEADVHEVCCELFRPPSVGGERCGTLPEAAWSSLRDRGFAIIDGFLPPAVAAGLADVARRLFEAGALWSPRQHNRDDLLMFLRREDAAVAEHAALATAMEAMLALRAELCERLRLKDGEEDYECQLARFESSEAAGSVGFERHRDELPCGLGQEELEEEGWLPPRRVTAIVYAAQGWSPARGGALRLFPTAAQAGDGEVVVEPRDGRLVLFLSGAVDHQVEPLRRQTAEGSGRSGAFARAGLTCWFQ